MCDTPKQIDANRNGHVTLTKKRTSRSYRLVHATWRMSFMQMDKKGNLHGVTFPDAHASIQHYEGADSDDELEH